MKTSTLAAAGEQIGANLLGKYLTFRLGKESYGIAVLKIREIIQLTPITGLPNMPDYVKGVINLRGKIIPVVDLRAKFGLGLAASNERTCIIVVEVNLASHSKVHVGLVVDAVEEVVHLAAREIEQTPEFGASVDTSYILGMAKIKDSVKALLDIDRLISAETVAFVTH